MWLAKTQTVLVDEKGHAHLNQNDFVVVLCRGGEEGTFLTVPLERGSVYSVEKFASLSAPECVAFGGAYIEPLARIDAEGVFQPPDDFVPAPYETFDAALVRLNALRAQQWWLDVAKRHENKTVVEMVIEHETMRRRFL